MGKIRPEGGIKAVAAIATAFFIQNPAGDINPENSALYKQRRARAPNLAFADFLCCKCFITVRKLRKTDHAPTPPESAGSPLKRSNCWRNYD
ncbi:hypothetical protein [Rhizobium cremeum]|uniref:hypothetical protein n=1 Tax=Rhizobium cremeum TaxID=2813827 RepID=UPI0013B03A12